MNSMLEMIVPNLSGGSCTILRCGGQVLLIDFGNTPHFEPIDATLKAHNIRHIGHALLTHYHKDHFGAMAELLAAYMQKGQTVWTQGEARWEETATPAATVAEVQRTIGAAGLQCETPPAHFTLGGAQLDFLNTDPALFENYYGTVSEPAENGQLTLNDFSVVTKIRHGTVNILHCADIETAAQKALYPYVEQADLCVLPHHGRSVGGYPPFLDKVRPKAALAIGGALGYPGQKHDLLWCLQHGTPIYTAFGKEPFSTFFSDGQTLKTNAPLWRYTR